MGKQTVPFYKFLSIVKDEEWAKMGYSYIGHVYDLFNKVQLKDDISYRWYIVENKETGDRQVFSDNGNTYCSYIAPYDLFVKDCLVLI